MAEENLPGKDDMAAIDVTALHALKELGGGDELVAEIVKTYLAHASSLVREFADAESIADAEAMLRIAHTLKSSSANVGAMRLSAMCAEMEASARAGRPCSEKDVARLQKEYDASAKALRSFLATNGKQ